MRERVRVPHKAQISAANSRQDQYKKSGRFHAMTMVTSHRLSHLFLLLISYFAFLPCATSSEEGICTPNEAGKCDATPESPNISEVTSTEKRIDETSRKPSHSSSNLSPLTKQTQPCNFYYATSTIPGAGLGLFTTQSLPKSYKVANPDIAIHVVDPPTDYMAYGLRLFLHNYAWDGHVTGGQYEGANYVAVAIPGVGMSANGHTEPHASVLPFRPVVDEADLPRTEAPGAGAISHYYNFSFYTSRDVTAGEELLLNYGDLWFEERMSRVTVEAGDFKRSVEYLLENGMCADNIKSDSSKISEAGRGAFATRFIPKGALVAPLPLIPLTKQSLEMSRTVTNGKSRKETIHGQQLLLNYCFGHPQSDILLYPYTVGVNFVNHANGDDGKYNANAELRWSNNPFHQSEWLTKSAAELLAQSLTGLMLDLVATRDIRPGEEIFIDYGSAWTKAWEKHVKQWEPVKDAESYAPSYVMNDVVDRIRTKEEQEKYGQYPDNLQTACFYKYQDNAIQKKKHSQYDSDGVTMIKWRPSVGIQELQFLRPCTILKRDEDKERGASRYTVQMLNRPGNMTPVEERIPKEEVKRHIVEQVPRPAIRFVDKPYTTDQHLPNAFRHYIGLPEGMFPDAWMNKVPEMEANEDE